MAHTKFFMPIPILVVSMLLIASTQADSFHVNDSSTFNTGNYTSTEYSDVQGYLQLTSGQTQGTYTSKVFDGSGLAMWNNISWITDVCYQCPLPSNLSAESGDYLQPIDMSQNQLLYHLDESSGPITDSSGSLHDGEVHGTTLAYPGKFNNSAYFDGNDWIAINMSYSSSTTLDNLTVCGWFKVGPGEGLWSIVDFDRSEFYNLEVGRQKANVVNFATTDTNRVIHDMGGTTNVMDNQWHLGCGVFNVTDKIIYVDGEQDYQVSNPHGGRSIGSGRYERWGFIGDGSEAANYDGNRNNIYFTGYIDEVAIWHRSLSPNEIANLYKRGALMLNISVRFCDDDQCDGETFLDINDTSPQATNTSNSNFFQFRMNLQSDSTALSPITYGATIDYSPLIKVHWIKTTVQGKNRYFIAKNESIRLLAKVQYDPEISIIDPLGNIVISESNMTNISSPQNNIGIWYYDFIPNTTGWYSAQIAGKTFSHLFYSAQVWQNNQTDHNGVQYPFRIALNISESASTERSLELTDTNINFTYKAKLESIRLVAKLNTTQFVEIPHQTYNTTYEGSLITQANLAFPVSLNASEEQIYYIYYSRNSANATNYTSDLNVTLNSSKIEIDNARYRLVFNLSKGGVIQDIYSKRGTLTNMAGFSPGQLSPSVQVGPYTYRASDVASPDVGLAQNEFMTRLNTSGTAGTIDFLITYTFFALEPYIKIKTQITARSTETWSSYKDHNFYLTDGYFNYAEWKNTTGSSGYEISSQDGTDQESLGNLTWITAYSNLSGNSVSLIFIENQTTKSFLPDAQFSDDHDYEHISRILYSGAVAAGYSFNSTAALVIPNGIQNSDELAEISSRIFNPINISVIASSTFDSYNPQFNQSNYTPQSPYDNTSVTCYSYWLDNIELDYALITVNSSGFYNQSTRNLSVNQSWINITLNTTILGAGQTQCNITVFDIAQNKNETIITFNISDSLAPEIDQVNYSPSINASLDPNTTINITSIIKEYTNVSAAVLQYRNSSIANWTNKSMHLETTALPNFTYTSNISANTEGVWQFRIWTNDTYGNEQISETYDVNIFYDLTWELSPASFGANSAQLNENVTLGNLTINNTGDLPLDFVITSNWADNQDIFFNGSQEGDSGYNVSVSSGSSEKISVVVVAASVERSDSLELTVSAENASAAPIEDKTSATIISYASGPFLYLSITEFPASLTQGDTGVSIIAKIQNKGNESANNPWLYLTLPAGWTITGGMQNTTVSVLDVNEELYNSITISVSSSAQTGLQNISASAHCDENKSATSSASVVVIADQSQQIPQTPQPGGGGGGSSSIPLPNLNNNTFESIAGMDDLIDRILRGEELLESAQTIELVRGQKESFEVTVTNIFEGRELKDLRISIEGYLSEYMQTQPSLIKEISYSESAKFFVTVTSPEYMEKGKHDLNIVIKGQIEGAGTIKRLVDRRNVELVIHEVSRTQAQNAIDIAQNSLKEMMNSGFRTTKTKDILKNARNSLDSRDYEKAKELADQINMIKSKAFELKGLVQEVTGDLEEARSEEIKTANILTGAAAGVTDTFSETTNLINLAVAAMEREDFDTALKRIQEASLALAVERSKINPAMFLLKHWWIIPLIILLMSATAFFGFREYTKRSIEEKLKNIDTKEHTLIQNIKNSQKKYYEQKTIDRTNFEKEMHEYRMQLSNLKKKRIRLRHKRITMLKPSIVAEVLQKERSEVSAQLKELQKRFYVKKSVSKAEFIERSAVLESRLAEIDEEKWSLKA